jgi:hypothetical protein
MITVPTMFMPGAPLFQRRRSLPFPRSPDRMKVRTSGGFWTGCRARAWGWRNAQSSPCVVARDALMFQHRGMLSWMHMNDLKVTFGFANPSEEAG